MKNIGDVVKALSKAMSEAQNALSRNKEYSEVWTSKYINDLPSSAFAVVEKGYKEGMDKGARHLPHHDKSVKSATEDSSVDKSHYRNALARVSQIKSVLGEESNAELRRRAVSHLNGHRDVLRS